MATYSIDMIRRDLQAAYRFYAECEQALYAYQQLGYHCSKDKGERKKYNEAVHKHVTQLTEIHRLEGLLTRSAR
jgi:hypothetical protein